MKEEQTLSETRTLWDSLWWVLKTIFVPVSVPLLFINIWNHILERKYRNCLPGKVVLITGASSGLGESLAHVFYKAGCKVVLAARREDELKRVRDDLLQQYVSGTIHPPIVMPLDLADLNSIPDFVRKVLEIHERIDILINNGGISVRCDAISSSMDVDLKVMLVNYFGAIALTKAVLPSMLKCGEGRIVFISSVQGKFALPHRSAYCASKHAIQAFSDSLRAELKEHGIKVTCISPGYVQTSISLNALTSDGSKYGKMDETTQKGYTSEEMAKYILKAVLRDEKDIIIAEVPARIAYWLRFLFPCLYFWIMEQRALKFSMKNKNN